jgi:uncharacterized phage protein gp47/JayE
VGAGLDRQVKMNGLARTPYTYSIATLTCTGTPGITLVNAFAQDQNNNLWALPTSVPLIGGTASAVATCTTPGAVTAERGTINIISTPQNGWSTVTNLADAIVGDPIETDSRLRARQAVSVALPALSPVAATVAAILAVLGVTRVAPGYPTPGGPGTSIENPTSATDSWSNLAHSITMVVEGGGDLDVATAIYAKKTIGCLAHGTTAVTVYDPVTNYPEVISFYRPSYVFPYIGMYVHGLTGFTSTTLAAIQTALVTYLSSLSIGEEVTYSALYGAALAVTPNLSQPEFSIKGLTLGTIANGLFTVVPGSAIGAGYLVNDTLTVAGGTGGTVTVASVNGSGGITGINPQVVAPGTGYALATGSSVTGGSGSAAIVNVTAVQPTAAVDLALLFYQAVQGLAANVVVSAV